MIIKKDFENRNKINEDKEDFKKYALNKGFDLEDILNFMEHYQNLISFEENIKNLRSFLK